jgi:hypothetical protein
MIEGWGEVGAVEPARFGSSLCLIWGGRQTLTHRFFLADLFRSYLAIHPSILRQSPSAYHRSNALLAHSPVLPVEPGKRLGFGMRTCYVREVRIANGYHR